MLPQIRKYYADKKGGYDPQKRFAYQELIQTDRSGVRPTPAGER